MSTTCVCGHSHLYHYMPPEMGCAHGTCLCPGWREDPEAGR